jgi:hypothetical protein
MEKSHFEHSFFLTNAQMLSMKSLKCGQKPGGRFSCVPHEVSLCVFSTLISSWN